MASQGAKPARAPSGFLEGKILIATPGMPDPRFERSVIFVCAHSDDGAMGIIVNKPFEGLGIRELLHKLEIPVTSNRAGGHVLFGGPVESGKGFVLHTSDYQSPEATLPVTSEIALTATRDVLCAIANGTGPLNWLFALGYAGWGPQQLEAEMGSNGWVHCDPDASLLFELDHAAKWRGALAKLGIDISGFSSEAGRA
jgi:putative transcriptional regulator